MQQSTDFPSWEAFAEAQGVEYRLQLGDLIRDLGADFISFVLATPADALTDRIPTQAQREVISELSAVWLEIKQTQPDPQHRRLVFQRRVCGYLPDISTSQSTSWHQRSGGIIPDGDDDLSLDGILAIIVRDIIGARLLASDLLIYQLMDSHPLFEKATTYLLSKDEPLRQIFKEEVEAGGETAALYNDFPFLAQLWHKMSMSPVSGSLELADTIEMLIVEAHISRFEPDDFIATTQKAVGENLKIARRLVQRETVAVPTYVGLVGMRLAEDIDAISHGDVTIRRSNPLDEGCLNKTQHIAAIAELETKLSIEDITWQRPYFGQTATPEQLKEFLGQGKGKPKKVDSSAAGESSIRKQIEQIKFSLLLCSDGALAVRDIFTHTMNPLSRLTLNSKRYIDGLNVVGDDTAMTSDQASDFVHWWDKAGQVPASLQIGMRRLLKAAAERDDPVDILVDAVVAWENLFGSTPETVFRVTGAMAIHLEPDDLTKRGEVLKELKTLYGHRSKLVHGALDVGSPKFGPQVVREEAARALAIGLEAYRKLLENDELASITTSEARATRLLVGV